MPRTPRFVQFFDGIPKIEVMLKSNGGYEIEYLFKHAFTPAERKVWHAIWDNRLVGKRMASVGGNGYKIAVKDKSAVLTYTNRIAQAVQETGAEWNMPHKTTNAIVDLLRKQVVLVPGGTPEQYAIDSSSREEKSGKTIPPRTGGRLCGKCGKYTRK